MKISFVSGERSSFSLHSKQRRNPQDGVARTSVLVDVASPCASDTRVARNIRSQGSRRRASGYLSRGLELPCDEGDRSMDEFAEADRRGLALMSTTSNKRL